MAIFQYQHAKVLMVTESFTNLLSRQLTAVGVILLLLLSTSCCLLEPGFNKTDFAPEVEIEVVWQIPMESQGQGCNSLFVGNKMYFPFVPGDSVKTINLDSASVEYSAENLDIATNPVISGDRIFIAKWSFIDKISAIYMLDLDGRQVGRINLDESNYGIDFILFSNNHFLYWTSLVSGSSSFVRLDTSTIQSIGGDEYTADVQVLCPPENNYACGANPSFYDGKVYLPVNHLEAYENGPYNSHILVYDEETGSLQQDLELDRWIPCSVMGNILIKSKDKAVIYRSLIDLQTGKFIEQIRAASSFAPLTEVEGYYYGSSSEHGGTDYTSLWKLNMETLEVEWYYQHEYSLGTQPQVVDGIVYVTAPDMILLFDADTGKILAKDTDLKGHPIQHANSYLYGDLMIFHDGYNITAIRTNWKKTLFGVEKTE